jgi:hypothetical protein
MTIDGFQGTLKLDLKLPNTHFPYPCISFKFFKLFQVHKTWNLDAMNKSIFHNPLKLIINSTNAINIIYDLFISQFSNYKISYSVNIFKDP